MFGLHPDERLVTGIEDDPDEEGLTRVYIGPRYHWIYVLVGGEDAEEVKRAFASSQHLTLRVPAGSPMYVDEEGRDAARRRAEEEWEARR